MVKKIKICKIYNKNKKKRYITLKKERDNLFRNYNELLNNSFCDKKGIYFLNDTSLNLHLGCKTVVKNIKACCESNNLKIIFYDRNYGNLPNSCKNYHDYIDIIKKADILLFNGEGTLHDSRGVDMLEKCKLAKDLNKKLVLFNTVWQNNKDIEKYLEMFDIIAARESISAKEMQKITKKRIEIVPDMTFYSDRIIKEEKTRQIIFTDSVKNNITNELYEIAKKLNCPFYFFTSGLKSKYVNQNYITEDIIASLSPNSLIVTGRFHMLTFALKYGIPAIAIPSNTHKMEGLLKDADLEEYLIKETDNFEEKIQEFLNKNHDLYYKNSEIYSANAKEKIENLFKQIQFITNQEQRK